MEWEILKMTYSFEKVATIGLPSKVDSKKKKFYKHLEPFHCKKCNKVWQPLRDYGNFSDYLIGFPKIGCTKKTCTKCEE